MIGGSFIGVVDNILESGFEGEAAIEPNAVGEWEKGPTEGAAVGEHEGHELRGERVELLGGLGFEETEELDPGRAVRPGRDEAQDDVDRERREDEVGVFGVGGDDALRQQNGDVGLIEDGLFKVHWCVVLEKSVWLLKTTQCDWFIVEKWGESMKLLELEYAFLSASSFINNQHTRNRHRSHDASHASVALRHVWFGVFLHHIFIWYTETPSQPQMLSTFHSHV